MYYLYANLYSLNSLRADKGYSMQTRQDIVACLFRVVASFSFWVRL